MVEIFDTFHIQYSFSHSSQLNQNLLISTINSIQIATKLYMELMVKDLRKEWS